MTLPIFMYRDVFPHPDGLGLVGMIGDLDHLGDRPKWYHIACYVLPRSAPAATGWIQKWVVESPLIPNTTTHYRIVGLRGWAAPDGTVAFACALSNPGKPDKFAYKIGDQPWTLPAGMGCASPWPCLVWHNGTSFEFIDQNKNNTYVRFSPGETPVPKPLPFYPEGSSMGVRQMLPDGTFTWGENLNPRGGYIRDTSHGVTLLNIMKLAGLWIGQNNQRTEGIVNLTGQRFVVNKIEGHDVRFAHDPIGGRFVSSSWAPTTSGNFTVVWERDALPPWYPPPAIVPKFTKTSEKIGIGLFDDAVGPRIIDVSETVSPNVRAVFWQTGTPGTSQSRALAKSLNVGAEAYRDGYGLTPAQVPEGFRALVFAYPSETKTVKESLALVKTSLVALRNAGTPIDLALAMYCQFRKPGDYALPVQKVMDMLKGAWDLGVEFHVGSCWGFTKRRVYNGQVVDGVDYWPELEECYRRLQAASGDWKHFPPYSVAPPPEPFWTPLGSLIHG